MADPLPHVHGGFRCISADPPWPFDNRATRAAAENHYPVMSLYEILTLPVERIAAKDAHLYLWVPAAHLRFAFDVMQVWGFTYKQTLIWVKTKSCPRLQIGLGNYWRHAHEICLFGVRGKLARLHKGLPSVVFAPRTRHSAKPAEFMERVEQFSPGPRLEMFARGAGRPGWSVWGHESCPR